jgi:hypothetical protein
VYGFIPTSRKRERTKGGNNDEENIGGPAPMHGVRITVMMNTAILVQNAGESGWGVYQHTVQVEDDWMEVREGED